MKAFKAIFFLFILAAVYVGCVSDSKKIAADKTVAVVSPKIVSGDFNGDGKQETATLIKPQLNKEGTACLDNNCMAFIRFSDTTIHPISIKHCIGGTPDNLGDLNGDGRDELGILPDWFTSCWRDYEVYSYKNNEWIKPVAPIPTHCNQWEAKVKPIEKDSLNKGYVVIRYSEMVKDSIKTKSKIVSIK
ncbi:MAG: hypothetical protein ABIN91_10595 [Mucilaginibacter sp.]|uniref:hypothetical protein n=1 Tax=Mucilaginibacter sp. TaxID=1882438 RepID=UPI0032631750